MANQSKYLEQLATTLQQQFAQQFKTNQSQQSQAGGQSSQQQQQQWAQQCVQKTLQAVGEVIRSNPDQAQSIGQDLSQPSGSSYVAQQATAQMS